MHASIQRSASTTPSSEKSAENSRGPSPMRDGLRGMSFDEGASYLAPVQQKRAPVQKRVVQMNESESEMDSAESSAGQEASDANQSCVAEPDSSSVEAPAEETPADGGECTMPEQTPADDSGGAPGPAAQPESPEVVGEMEFPAGDHFGFSFGVTSKDGGGAFVKGFAKVPNLPSLNVPICTGVFFQAKPDIKGGFSATRTKNSWELEAGVSASCAATIRGGLPSIASVGAGVELEGKLSMTLTNSGSGWSGTPPTFALSGAPVIDVQIFETSKKVGMGTIELLKISPTASGYKVSLGSGVQSIADSLLNEDAEAAREACKANTEDGGASGASAEPANCG